MKENLKSIKNILFRHYKSHLTELIIGTILILMLSIISFPIPFLTRSIIDVILPSKNMQKLLLSIAFILLISIIQNLLNFYQNILFYKVNSRIIFDLRVSLLKKINKVALKIINSFGSGYFISRIEDDTKNLNALMFNSFTNIIKDILTLLFGIISMFYINIKLAFISLILVILYSYSMKFFNDKIRTKASRYFEKCAKTAECLVESINMIKIIKILLAYGFNIERYYKIGKEKMDSNIAFGSITFIASLTSGLTIGILPIIIITYGSYQIMNDELTLGALLAFNSLINYVTGPSIRLLNTNIDIQQGLVALKRLKEVFDLQEDPLDLCDINKINSLEMEQVYFSYTNVSILQNINFTLKAGEKVAIVGESGSGKSTILNLLIGMYPLSSGKILINNFDQQQSSLSGCREIISLIDQELFILDDSIYNNIKMGNEKATEHEIFEAAYMARINEFVDSLSDGYNTIVGSNGSNLSIGQKQRVVIARALVRKPQLLLLDEITANIDSINESIIYDMLFKDRNTSVIVITHKLNMIKKCDKILVLDKGTIIEEGSHHSLLQKKGLYYKLYRSEIE